MRWGVPWRTTTRWGSATILGEHDTFYLQAMAVSPQLRNQIEVEAMVLDALRARVERLGFSAISSVIEARLAETGPRWMRTATVLETIDNYLQSGIRFVYLRAPCGGATPEG